MEFLLDVDPGVPIRGRMRCGNGPWHEFTGWSQVVAEVEEARKASGPGPMEGLAQGVRGDAGADPGP